METAPAFLVGTHPYAFRSGEAAEIVGVKTVFPKNGRTPRPCFEVKYQDGVIDYTPVSEVENGNYAIICKKS